MSIGIQRIGRLAFACGSKPALFALRWSISGKEFCPSSSRRFRPGNPVWALGECGDEFVIWEGHSISTRIPLVRGFRRAFLFRRKSLGPPPRFEKRQLGIRGAEEG